MNLVFVAKGQNSFAIYVNGVYSQDYTTVAGAELTQVVVGRVEGRNSTALVDEVALYNFSATEAQVKWLSANQPSTEMWALREVTIDCGSTYSASAANAVEADGVALSFADGATFTIDEDLARDYSLVCEGSLRVVGSHVSDANLARLGLAGVTGNIKVILNDDNLASANLSAPTVKYIYRYEGPTALATVPYYSESHAGVVEIACPVTDLVDPNLSDVNLLGRFTGNKGRVVFDTGFSLVNEQVRLNIGNADGMTQHYIQKAGDLVFTQAGEADVLSGGQRQTPLLIGHYSNATVSYDLVGGSITAPNGVLALGWDASRTTVTVGGGTEAATLTATGINGRQRDGTASLTVSPNGTVALTSASGIKLNSQKKIVLAGGTLSFAETCACINGTWELAADTVSTVAVAADKTVTVSSSVTGTGAIRKTGAGTLAVGLLRPKMDLQEGKLGLTATLDELTVGEIVLPLPVEASPCTKECIVVQDTAGASIAVSGVAMDTDAHTLTVSLQTIPLITEEKAISALNLASTASGMLIIQGAENEEDAFDVTFDTVLPENVNVTVSGFANLKVSGEQTALPINKITFLNGSVVTIDTSCSLTVPSGVTVRAKGDINVTLTNNGTFTVVSGRVNVTAAADQSVKGTVNILDGTTYVSKSSDSIAYAGSTIVNVYGTLDMGTTRWTVGGTSQLNLYGGCAVLGVGDGSGVLDLYRSGTVITVNAVEGKADLVTIAGLLRARWGNNGGSTITIGNGMRLAIPEGIAPGGNTEGRILNITGAIDGTLKMKGIEIDYTVTSSEFTYNFDVVSGVNRIRMGRDGATAEATQCDSQDEPFITVRAGATLNFEMRDMSGWAGSVSNYGWIKNYGTLNINPVGESTRYFRNHLVLTPGTTTSVGANANNKNLILYGGFEDENKAQIIVPDPTGSATKATMNGAGTIQLNVNGSNGTPGACATVAAGSELEIANAIVGGETFAKYGNGLLSLTGNLSGYTGTIKLRGGKIAVPSSFTNISTDVEGMQLAVSTNEGTTTYRLVQKSFIVIIK